MTLIRFTYLFRALRDVDRIDVDPLCDHPEHIAAGKQIGKKLAMEKPETMRTFMR